MTTPFASKEALGELLKSWAPSYEPYAGMFDLGICDLAQLANVSAGTLATLLAKVANQLEGIQHRLHAEDIIVRATKPGAEPQVPSQRQKFIGLLKKAGIPGPLPKVMATIVRHYARRVELIDTPDEAAELYNDAKNLPGSSTKRHLLTQQRLFVNGPLFPDAAMSHLLTAVCIDSGQPCVVKFLDQGAARGEAQATRIICSDMPAEVPLVPGRLVDLALGKEHSELRRPPGTYAVLVTPRYLDALSSALYMSNEVLAREMRRMVQALDWVHSKGYVHMDVKDANIFMDLQGCCFLGDLGSAVERGSPITSTTPAFAPSNHLWGTPARCEYDWYMLLATLVCTARPNTRHELLDSGGSYMEATKLKACAEQLASDAPVLHDLVSDLLKRAGDLFHA